MLTLGTPILICCRNLQISVILTLFQALSNEFFPPNKNLHWRFVSAVTRPQVVHVRVGQVQTKDNLFAQITVKIHSKQVRFCCSTFYNLTSVCTFLIPFSVHFLRCWQREFVEQLKASLVSDHFLYSHDLKVCFMGNIVGRN